MTADSGVLAQMLVGLDRFTDEQIAAFGVEVLRLFFTLPESAGFDLSGRERPVSHGL